MLHWGIWTATVIWTSWPADMFVAISKYSSTTGLGRFRDIAVVGRAINGQVQLADFDGDNDLDIFTASKEYQVPSEFVAEQWGRSVRTK